MSVSKSDTIDNVSTSVGETPYSSFPIPRVSATAPARPSRMPGSVSFSPCHVGVYHVGVYYVHSGTPKAKS